MLPVSEGLPPLRRNAPDWAKETRRKMTMTPEERAQESFARGEIEADELERQLSAAVLGWPILGHTANCDCPGCVPPDGQLVPWRI
jgi:hypothetical protein